jgi:LCP family protein required for cell wall assembly
MDKKIILFCILIISLFTPIVGHNSVQAVEQQGGICNGPEDVMTILLIGTDTHNVGYLYGLADTIMVFRVDFRTGDVAVMGFPRDLWVIIPDVTEDNGRTHGKLNMAYHFGTEGMGYYSGEGYGAGLMQATFKENWDFEIDHYIVVNMRAFRNIIDAMDGIEVFNPSPVYSFKQKNTPKYSVGGYYFMGNEALLYARYRDPRNVVDRVGRHEIILKSMFDKLFSLSIIPKIPEIIGLYKGNVLSDLHLAEVSQLLCLAAKTDPDEVRFTRIPKDELFIPDWKGFVWLEKEPGMIKGILEKFAAGTWPEE